MQAAPAICCQQATEVLVPRARSDESKYSRLTFSRTLATAPGLSGRRVSPW